MFEKRGLSAIVATLIIILLTLVAVGIIWAVVRNILQSGAEEVELGQFTLDLQIKAVQVEDGDVTIVLIRRNQGQGEFVGMNFIFSDGQNSEIIRENISLQELEEKTFTFTLTTISTSALKSVSVSPIYRTSSGKETIGSISDMFDVREGKSVTQTAGESSGGAFEELGFVGKGRAEYSVSSNAGIYPEFKHVIVDPVDVHVGDNQTFTAEVYSPNGIESVVTTTQLDTQVLNLPLEKISESSGVETWSVTWQVYDTHIEVYRTTFTATDNAGNQNSVDLTWTDDCTDQFVHGAQSLIDTPCTVNSLDGADTSNIVISGVTLTLDTGGAVAYTPGNSVSKSGNGKILFNGGSLTKQYLFYPDADEDLSRDNSTYSISTSSSRSGFVRAVNSTTSNDCDTSNSAVSVNRTQRLDTDSDNYTLTGSIFCASSSTWGNNACTTGSSNYSKNSTGTCLIIGNLSGTDCYDLNASAKTGQTSYFTAIRGVTTITPVANGSTMQWLNQGTGNSCGSGSNLWKCVETQDTGSSYLNTSTQNQDFLVELSNASLGGGTIAQIEISYQCRRTVSGNANSQLLINEGGTTTAGTDHNCADAAWTSIFTDTYTTNPRTGSAWTESQINNLQAGVRHNQSTAREVRVTALWAVVRVNDSAGNNWNSFDYNCDSSESKSVTEYEIGCDGQCNPNFLSTPACSNTYDPISCDGSAFPEPGCLTTQQAQETVACR